MDVGLGGYAAHVETGATNVSFLENNDLQALLGGIFSGAITAWACADNNQINFRH
jgi:hypothetical protein